jgi:hypothetical protein
VSLAGWHLRSKLTMHAVINISGIVNDFVKWSHPRPSEMKHGFWLSIAHLLLPMTLRSPPFQTGDPLKPVSLQVVLMFSASQAYLLNVCIFW